MIPPTDNEVVGGNWSESFDEGNECLGGIQLAKYSRIFLLADVGTFIRVLIN